MAEENKPIENEQAAAAPETEQPRTAQAPETEPQTEQAPEGEPQGGQSAETEPAPTPSARDRVRGKIRDAYPDQYGDRDFENDDEEFGAVENYMNDADQRISRYKESESRLAGLLNSNKLTEAIFLAMAHGVNPVSFLAERFGPEIKDWLATPEGLKAFNEAVEKYSDNLKEHDKAMEQRDANLKESFKRLADYAREKNLSDEQVEDIFGTLWNFGMKALDGTYDTEDFEFVRRLRNYDSDVDQARREGLVTGRNEKITEKLQKSKPAAAMPTSMEGGTADTTKDDEGRRPLSFEEQLDADPFGFRRREREARGQ